MAALQAAVNGDRPSQISDAPVTRHVPLDPAILARRARFRRIVGWALVPAAIIAVIAGAKLLSHQQSIAADPPSSSPAHGSGLQPVTTNPSRPARANPAPTPPAVDPPAPPSASAAPAPAASEAPSSEPPAASASAEPGLDVAATKKEVLKLLNQGKSKQALPLAQSALAADPEDADLYLYVGTALEDAGKRKDAIEVYSRCVHEAKRGPVHECRAVGGK